MTVIHEDKEEGGKKKGLQVDAYRPRRVDAKNITKTVNNLWQKSFSVNKILKGKKMTNLSVVPENQKKEFNRPNFEMSFKTPEIMIKEGVCKTTSLNVAEYFDKRHDNILRDIENLECSEEFNQLNFEVVEYRDAKGESRPMIEMTRDGFVFLVMGFTGKKAAQWKEAYIKVFNKMETVIIKDICTKAVQRGVRAMLIIQTTLKRSGKDMGWLKTLERLRKYNRLTQKQTARLLNVSKDTVQKYEYCMRDAGISGI